jgi:membrane-associated protease RseP (regulator of RpoE activity)
MAKAFGMPNAHGVAIAQVEANSPARKAGLKVGDVITAVNGTPMDDVNAFRLQVAGYAPNTTINLAVERNGQSLNLPVTLSELNLEAENKGAGEGNLPGGGEKGALNCVRNCRLPKARRASSSRKSIRIRRHRLPDSNKATSLSRRIANQSPRCRSSIAPLRLAPLVTRPSCW